MLSASVLTSAAILENKFITKISRKESISEQTLRNWRDKARRRAMLLLVRMLFLITGIHRIFFSVETASMNETELAEYARKKDLYIEQIKAWKDACMNANGGIAKEASRLNRELKDSEKERRKLEKELQRKEKALAEAAALLVLSKKANLEVGHLSSVDFSADRKGSQLP